MAKHFTFSTERALESADESPEFRRIKAADTATSVGSALIFGDFSQYSAIFANFRRFLPNFRRFSPIFGEK
jgi:hypothetical protein